MRNHWRGAGGGGYALEKRVLAADRNAASFASKILKKINALRPKLRRLPCPGVHGPLRGACESSRGLTLPQARSGLRAVSALPLGAAPCQGEVHSMFAAMATIPYKQNASCAHDMPRFSLSRRGRQVPTRRAFSRHGRNRCRGEEMPPDRTRHDCKFRAWRVSEGTAAPVCFAR